MILQIPHLYRTCDVEWYKVSRCASPQVPAGFLSDRRPGVYGSGGAAAAVVTAPAQRGAIWAAGGRGWRGRRVSHWPQSKHRGGGFIFVELFGGRLEEEEREEQLDLVILCCLLEIKVSFMLYYTTAVIFWGVCHGFQESPPPPCS